MPSLRMPRVLGIGEPGPTQTPSYAETEMFGERAGAVAGDLRAGLRGSEGESGLIVGAGECWPPGLDQRETKCDDTGERLAGEW